MEKVRRICPFFKLFLTLIFLADFLVGCSKSSNSTLDSNPHREHFRTATETKSLIDGAQVSCENTDSARCSPSVGMLITLEKSTDIFQCTAFLIAPNIAVTNSHCIPQDLKSTHSNCTDRMWLYFPNVGELKEQRSECSEVLFASKIQEDSTEVSDVSPDYAVLRLKQSITRPFLKLSRDGFKDQGIYQIMKMNPHNGFSIGGLIVNDQCTAIHNSHVIPHSSANESLNMTLADCTIEHGNSGSPLIDADGNVVGILQLKFSVGPKFNVLDLNPSYPSNYTELATLGGGTGFSCLDFRSELQASGLDASKCRSIESPIQSPEAEKKAVFSAQIKESLNREVDALSRHFKWIFENDSTVNPSVNSSVDSSVDPTNVLNKDGKSSPTENYISIPECVSDTQELLHLARDSSTNLEDKATFKELILKIAVNKSYNRYLVLEHKLTKKFALNGNTLSFNSLDFAKNSNSKFQILDDDGISDIKKILFEKNLGVCETTN